MPTEPHSAVPVPPVLVAPPVLVVPAARQTQFSDATSNRRKTNPADSRSNLARDAPTAGN
jgi:hypothetical protein